MKKTLLVIGFTIAMSALGATYWYFNSEEPAPADPNETGNLLTQQPATTTDPVSEKLAYNGQPIGYLGDPAIIAKYPEEFISRFRERLAIAVEMIGKYPEDEVYWIELGIVKKNFDNFIGARDAWEHARLLNKRNAVVYHNLGNLYALYLGDPKKAEAYFKASISLDPLSAQPYLALAEFYQDTLKEKSDLVDDVLLAGLSQMPHEANLVLNLAFYYKSVGDKEKAVKYLEEFLALPETNEFQAFAIKKELESLGAR